jgi:putative ABC transport system permease protein
VFLDYSSAFGLIAMDRKLFDRYWDDQLADMYNVYVREGADPHAVRAAIDRAIAEKYNVFVLTNADLKAKIRRMIDDSFTMVRLQELIAILVALLGLLNTLLIAVLERTREIGVLRAVGARRRQVALSIVVEAMLMGVAGAVLGVLLGGALSWVNVDVISIMHTGWRVDYAFAWTAAAQLFGMSLLTAAVAAYLPARRAARLNITEALEYE